MPKKKFSKAQQYIVGRLWIGDIIQYHYETGYHFIRGHHLPIKHSTMSVLEDVLTKTVTDDWQVFLTLNSEAVEKIGNKFKRKTHEYNNY